MLAVAILAGGLATRLRPATEQKPKTLLEVSGEPFIVHQLRLLRLHHIQRVVLCVGFLGEMIREVIKDGHAFGLQVDYSFDGPSLLGTAGAINNALPLLGNSFFVLYGDSYLMCNYASVARTFQLTRRLALMTVFRNNGKWDNSNVEFEGGQILMYSKKRSTPRMQYIDYGLGVFSAKAFNHILPGQAHDLSELYGELLAEGQLAGMEVRHRFYEIGSPSGLEETSSFLASQRTGRG